MRKIINSILYKYKNWLQVFHIFCLYIIISLVSKLIENNNITNQNLNIDYRNIQKKINYQFNNTLTNPIKLGIFAYCIKNGGRARVTSLLINYLYGMNIFKIYLFTHFKKEKDEYFLPKNIKRILIEKQTMESIINKYKLDILIYEYDNIKEIRAINELNNAKSIFYIHASIFYYIYKDIELYKELYSEYRKSKYIISMIPLEVNYLFQKWGINSLLMDNFVTCQYNNVVQSNLKEKIILMFGRGNDKFKRFNLGIQSMEYISKEVINSNLYIITNLTYGVNLVSLVSKLNLEKNIKFFDYISTPELYFRNASLNFLLSMSESFPLVLLETKMYGIPNILMGIDYTMISNEGTIIIYDDQPESLARASTELLLNHTRLKNLSEKARKSLKRFNNFNLIIKWVKLILFIFNDIDIKKFSKKYNTNFESILKRQVQLLTKRNKEFHTLNVTQFLDFNYMLQINLNKN